MPHVVNVTRNLWTLVPVPPYVHTVMSDCYDHLLTVRIIRNRHIFSR